MKTANKGYIYLVIWVISLMLIGSLLGSLTQNSVDTWYNTLNRSPLTPPNYLFGIVWSILYAMIATSGWMIWRNSHLTESSLIKKLYIGQLILNFSWTPLFFSYHFIGIALICLCIIAILVALLIYKSYAKLKTVSLILIPYLLWLLFATYLNLYIWQYN